MRVTAPLDQPEFARVYADMIAEMRRRREAGEFCLSAPRQPEFSGREDFDRRQRKEDWA